MLDEYWKYTLFTLFMILAFEGTTAFSRLKNMQQLRGMSAKAFELYVYRNGEWTKKPSSALLPRDVISLGRAPGSEPTTVPADCVLLRGGAVLGRGLLYMLRREGAVLELPVRGGVRRGAARGGVRRGRRRGRAARRGDAFAAPRAVAARVAARRVQRRA